MNWSKRSNWTGVCWIVVIVVVFHMQIFSWLAGAQCAVAPFILTGCLLLLFFPLEQSRLRLGVWVYICRSMEWLTYKSSIFCIFIGRLPQNEAVKTPKWIKRWLIRKRFLFFFLFEWINGFAYVCFAADTAPIFLYTMHFTEIAHRNQHSSTDIAGPKIRTRSPFSPNIPILCWNAKITGTA